LAELILTQVRQAVDIQDHHQIILQPENTVGKFTPFGVQGAGVLFIKFLGQANDVAYPIGGMFRFYV
jgi:hypothetical protein